MSKAKRKLRKAWAVQQGRKHPCIFGTRRDARENRDIGENVVQIEYRIVKDEGPWQRSRRSWLQNQVGSGTQATDAERAPSTRRSAAPK